MVGSAEASGDVFRLRSDDVVWREVDGEIIVLEMGTGTYLNLNGSAGIIWRALSTPARVEELVDLLVETYGISQQTAASDTLALLADLRDRSLVEVVA